MTTPVLHLLDPFHLRKMLFLPFLGPFQKKGDSVCLYVSLGNKSNVKVWDLVPGIDTRGIRWFDRTHLHVLYSVTCVAT